MQLFLDLRRLFAFILRYSGSIRNARPLATAVVVAGAVTGLTNTAMIGIVNHVINADGADVKTLAWIFVGICVLLPVSRYFAEILLNLLAERATMDLRMLMSRRILRAPLRKVEEVGAPRVMAALANDTPAVIGALSTLPVLCMNIAVVGGSLVYMGILSWRLLLTVLVFMVVGMLAYQLPLLRAQRHIQAAREHMEDLFRHFRAVGEAVKELKLNQRRRNAFLDGRLRDTVTQIHDNNVAATRLFATAVSWGQVLAFVLVGLVAFVIPAYSTVDKAVLTGYVLAILYMVSPVQVILNAMPQLSRATAAMRRLEDLGISLEESIRPVPELPLLDELPRWSTLELDGVTHTYYSERDQSNFTLGPVSLVFEPAEIVFLTGGNGSGKTSFAKLLTGLYMPESGEIRLDGEPVTDATVGRYNEHFSAVFSDFFLFDSLLGLESVGGLDEQARHYLEELHLDHKVKVEDGKLSTTELSSGQRKRLALVNAYLEDRPIYLFDEWAADQDPQFKTLFYRELLPALRDRGKTVFVISHDDRYFDVADRMIKLDYGQVVFDSRAGAGLPPVEAAASGPVRHSA
ncbi:MAG TPA: cyclic peptide export ABC transporter [Longimicrobiaceae bacterium]|nr:cyclic peptide export ABC transporter [Longimicrobiaceae bacterium]